MFEDNTAILNFSSVIGINFQLKAIYNVVLKKIKDYHLKIDLKPRVLTDLQIRNWTIKIPCKTKFCMIRIKYCFF